MKENDLIRRGDALARKEVITEVYREHGASFSVSYSVVTVDNINAIPAVEQPMSAVEYARKLARMCASHTCGKCPFHESEKFSAVSCVKFEGEYPEEAVAIVQKWTAENKA